MAQSAKERRAMFARLSELNNDQITKLAILTGTKPEFRPDINFNIGVLPKFDAKLLKELKQGGLEKKVPFDKEILGIQSLNSGQVRVNFIEGHDTKSKTFPTFDEAEDFRNSLLRKRFKNNQDTRTRFSIEEFEKRKREGTLKGKVEVDRKFVKGSPELSFVEVELKKLDMVS